MGSLLEKARQTPQPVRASKEGVSEDRVELAVAVLTGEVSWAQARVALELADRKNSQPGQYLWAALRQAYIRGLLVKGK